MIYKLCGLPLTSVQDGVSNVTFVSVVVRMEDVDRSDDVANVAGLLLHKTNFFPMVSKAGRDSSFRAIEDYALQGQLELIADILKMSNHFKYLNILTEYALGVIKLLRKLRSPILENQFGVLSTDTSRKYHGDVSILLTSAKRAITKLAGLVRG